MTNVLVLSRYAELGASSRLRSFQYVSQFESFGLTVTVAPLFDNSYLQSLYQAKSWFRNLLRNVGHVFSAYIRRLQILHKANQFDVVWIEKEIFPYLPSVFEEGLARRGIPYVVDYDDAVFHNYDLHRSSVVRYLLGHKLDKLLQCAYAVSAGNPYLQEYALGRGTKRVLGLPTVIDIDRYHVSEPDNNRVLRIGWIGSPSTSQYLEALAEPLRKLAGLRSILVVTVGARTLVLPGVALQQHDWTLESEVALIETFDVGIMPLSDSPWERGKCGYKLIQYMACARPVVASPVGVNVDIVSEDLGFLAVDGDDWIAALTQLADDPSLRWRMGLAGRAKVEREYSLQVTAPKIAQLLIDAVKGYP